MKKHFLFCIILVLSFSFFQTAFAYKGQKSISGITQSWGTTKHLDELYSLKRGWTVVKITRAGKCVFDTSSWDEIDSFSPLYRDLLKEADANGDQNVTSTESSRLLQMQKKVACQNARRRNIY